MSITSNISPAGVTGPRLPNGAPLILASSSPYRREMLQRLHLPFSCHSPAIDESRLPQERPGHYVRRLARAKAEIIAAQHPQSWVIGSDQAAVLVRNDSHGLDVAEEILGKPGEIHRAQAQLARCSGHRVQFLTALCLLVPGRSAGEYTDLTTVHFRQLSAEEIQRYVALEQPLNCAGSFKVESYGISLFERVESDDPTALIGLPLIALCRMMRQAGARLP